jgi:hypothetical protein
MCGCNKGRANVSRHAVSHVVNHGVSTLVSTRIFPTRVSRGRPVPESVPVPESIPESVPESVPVPESVSVSVSEPVMVQVNRFPPRIARASVEVSVPVSVPIPVHTFPPRVSRAPVVVSAPVSEPLTVSRFPPRHVNPRVRGIPQRLNRGLFAEHQSVVQQPAYNAETTVWGPLLWKVLHTLAEFNTDPSLWNDLISRLTIDIPCIICRTHFTTYINSQPILSFDTISLINWFFTLHNSVNQRTGKPVITDIPSFESFRASLPTLIQELSVSFPPETLQILLQLGQNPP